MLPFVVTVYVDPEMVADPIPSFTVGVVAAVVAGGEFVDIVAFDVVLLLQAVNATRAVAQMMIFGVIGFPFLKNSQINLQTKPLAQN